MSFTGIGSSKRSMFGQDSVIVAIDSMLTPQSMKARVRSVCPCSLTSSSMNSLPTVILSSGRRMMNDSNAGADA